MGSGSIDNPNAAFGQSAALQSSGTQVEEYLAKTTVSAGDVVALSSTSGAIIKCLTDTAQRLLVGIALEGIAASSTGLVCSYGPVIGVKKDTASAVTAGDAVTRAATDTAGVTPLAGTTAVTQYKDTNICIGVVMANAVATATTCDIFVKSC